MDTIGCYHRRARKFAAIRRLYPDIVATILEPSCLGIRNKFDSIAAAACIEQDIMEIDAVNDDVGIFETRPERRAGWNSHQFFAVQRVQQQQSRRRIRYCKDLVHKAETVKDVKNIGAELDAIADG